MSARVIKVCGITNPGDAQAAVADGATALGFNFYPRSKRYIPAEQAAPIAALVPVLKVGVFVNERPEEVARVARIVGLDVVQLHGSETAADAPHGLRVWKALRAGEDGFPAGIRAWPQAEAFLLDGPAAGEYGGAGKTFDWTQAADLGVRVILAGGLDASNVAAAIAVARPWGVDACSRIESAPGRKDRTKMREFLKAARAASEWTC